MFSKFKNYTALFKIINLIHIHIYYLVLISPIGTSYSELLEHINTIITKGGFSTKIPVEKRNVLRITISNLFSPIWDSNDMNIVTFLYKLRILVRSSYATCLITTQAHVIDDVRFYLFIFFMLHYNNFFFFG